MDKHMYDLLEVVPAFCLRVINALSAHCPGVCLMSEGMCVGPNQRHSALGKQEPFQHCRCYLITPVNFHIWH